MGEELSQVPADIGVSWDEFGQSRGQIVVEVFVKCDVCFFGKRQLRCSSGGSRVKRGWDTEAIVHAPFPQTLLSFLLKGFPSFSGVNDGGQAAVLPGEDPPPYSPMASPESGSAPMITCRVCQSPINVEGKMHQHVVKCSVCNEATVSTVGSVGGTMAVGLR